MMWQRKLAAGVVLGSLLATASALRADDTRPAARVGVGAGAGVNAGAGFGVNGGNGADDWTRGGGSAAAQRHREDNLSYAGAGAYPSDFPMVEVHDWVSASANAAAARAMFRRAENDLSATFTRAQHNFERSKDLQNALAAEREGYITYLLARQRALQTVFDNPRYQQIMSLHDGMARKLAAGRVTHELTGDEVLAIATLKLNYATDARAMEIAALNADGSVRDARNRMLANSARVTEMRANFDESLRDNPEVVSARRHLEDARVAVVTAQAYLAATSVAGNAAVDYAYYLHGNAQPRVYDTYSPYWVRY